MEVLGVFGKARTIFNVGGRNKKHLNVAYNNEQLPVRLSKLYLQEAHTKDHGGRDSRGDEVTGKGVDSDNQEYGPEDL